MGNHSTRNLFIVVAKRPTKVWALWCRWEDLNLHAFAPLSKSGSSAYSDTPAYKHKRYPMLAFYYPCRLDTTIITTSLDTCLSWSAAPLLVNHAKAVLLLGFQLMYIPFTSPHYNRTLVVRPIVWEWYIGNFKTSYRCLNIISPSYQASSFATGRGSPYCLRCRPTSTYIT